MSKYVLKLYVIGYSDISQRAIKNLEEICLHEEIKDKYSFEVIDLLKKPELVEEEKILATPLLIKQLPAPMRRIIGDLSNTAQVLVGLDLNAN